MSRLFRAPGKVVLVGEYAVLDGAPAVVAAVDSGVACRTTPADDRVVSTPGDESFVQAALDRTAAPPARYAFESWNPSSTPTKAGLGGSASAVVCAVLAARSLAGQPVAPATLYALGFDAHRAVQGSGSGIDVAASAWGALLRFRHREVEPLHLDLEPVVVWSGRSAKTGPRVETYRAWADRERFVEASTEIVQAFTDDPIEALRRGRRLLAEMSEVAGIDWRTDALDRLADLAEAFGGAAKPSGAGGGDCAVGLFPDAKAARAYRRACAEEGFTVLDVRLAPGAHEVPRDEP